MKIKIQGKERAVILELKDEKEFDVTKLKKLADLSDKIDLEIYNSLRVERKKGVAINETIIRMTREELNLILKYIDGIKGDK